MRKSNVESPIQIALAVCFRSRACTDGNCLYRLCSTVFKNSLLSSIKILFAFTINYTNWDIFSSQNEIFLEILYKIKLFRAIRSELE